MNLPYIYTYIFIQTYLPFTKNHSILTKYKIPIILIIIKCGAIKLVQ